MKTHLGHYEIVAELGRGGMGVVYKGYEPSLSRYVAIKELNASLTSNPQVVERFLREARSMAMLNDPHIIQIYSIGQQNDQPFFVMEFVDGACLSDVIAREGHLLVGDALKIVQQTAQGLAVAHARGVIHRDIKPANLMISVRGQIKIADFGIALASHGIDSKLTGAGEFVGTPGYLSPEIVQGQTIDARSDVFSLGVVLFEMLTGRTPFSVESVYKLVLEVVQSDIPDVREINADIDPGVAAILAKMLMKDPDKRYQSMRELLADLALHPLTSSGGELTLKITAAKAIPITMVGLATPMTPSPGNAGNDRTAPPVVQASGAIPALMNIDKPETPASEAATQLRLPVQKKSRLPVLLAGLSLLVFAFTLGWLAWRSDSSGGPGHRVASYTATAGEWWHIVKNQSIDAYGSARSHGIVLLQPLLNKLELRVSAGLIFDIVMILISLYILKSLLTRLFKRRAKNTKAYSH